MKNKFALSSKLSIDGKTEAQAEKLFSEIQKLKDGRGLLEKEVGALRGKIWEVYEAARRATVTGDPALVSLSENLQRLQEEKNTKEWGFFRVLEERNGELNTLLLPIRNEGNELIDAEMEKIQKEYVCLIPRTRVNPSGKEIDSGYTIDPESGRRWITCTSNASAIVKIKEIFATTKPKIRDAGNLTILLEILKDLDRTVEKIDLTPLPVRLEEGDLSRADPGRPTEIAFLLNNVIQPAKSARA